MENNRVYSKPLMVLEKFTPQEFVAGCSLTAQGLPFDTQYVRIDLNNNNQFDVRYSGSTLTYSERNVGVNDFHLFGTGKVTLSSWTIEDVNIYKIHSNQSNIHPSDENGHSYFDTNFYTHVASQAIKSSAGKYYLLEYNGNSMITMNAS